MWLELQGFPLLHGASLCLEGSAIGLLGYSGMGKSTLSSALWKRGCRLVTDDLIPILSGPPYLIDPGIPFSRMWPDTARFFIPEHTQLERVHPDFEKVRVPNELDGLTRFEEEPCPLQRLFILNRKLEPWEPTLERLSPASGLMELVRNSYHPDLVRALGLQPARMQKLASLMTSVPLFRLTYGSGFDKLEQVCDLIYANVRDLESVSP